MNCAGGWTTTGNRLGRTVGPVAPRNFRLCQPDSSDISAPILSRSAALLNLLLQDGTVDLELTCSVIALDPGLAFGTLQAANPEGNNSGIWQLPQAVVAAGCERLLLVVNRALKLESNYDLGTSMKLRQIYLRGLQRGCIAELLTNLLGNANPGQSYLAGLLFGLPEIFTLAKADGHHPSYDLNSAIPHCLLACTMPAPDASANPGPTVASVLLANELLEITEWRSPEFSRQLQSLVSSALWETWDGCNAHERCRLLEQGIKLGRWAAANAPRLSPWEFMTRLHRHKSWD